MNNRGTERKGKHVKSAGRSETALATIKRNLPCPSKPMPRQQKSYLPFCIPKPKPSNRASPYKGKYARVYCQKMRPKKEKRNTKEMFVDKCASAVIKRHKYADECKLSRNFSKRRKNVTTKIQICTKEKRMGYVRNGGA